MSLIWTIIIGFVVGLLARFLMPGRDPAGFIITTVLGIAGALLATFLGRALGFYTPNEPSGFIASIIGAVILLAIYRMVRRNRA